ncbi:mycothiol transferase [Cellulomonas sp. URHB0016]
MTPDPYFPPLAGTEVDHLVGSLDLMRVTFRWKADGLDAAGLSRTVGASTLTLGGLLKHLAAVEDTYFSWHLSGRHPGPIWHPENWQDNHTELLAAADDSPAELYALWDGAVARSQARLREAIASGGLDLPTHRGDDDGSRSSLRRLLFDLLQEYARHAGHADLIREAVDGRVGEDPPEGWMPEVGDRLTWLWRA